MSVENKENACPAVHASQPGCSSTSKQVGGETEMDQQDVKYIRKILGNITDEVIAGALQEYPDLSDQLSNLFSLKINLIGKRNASDDICTVEKKRVTAAVEKPINKPVVLKDTEELPTDNNQSVAKNVLEIKNKNLSNDAPLNRSNNNKNSIEMSTNQNTNATVTKPGVSGIQQAASRENAGVRAQSTAETAGEPTESAEGSTKSASTVSGEQSRAENSAQDQGRVTKSQPTASQKSSKAPELVKFDSITQEKGVNTRQVPQIAGAAVRGNAVQENQVMPIFVASPEVIHIRKISLAEHPSTVPRFHAASSSKAAEVSKKEVQKTLPTLVKSSGPQRQHVVQPVSQTASKKISDTQNRHPSTASTTSFTKFQMAKIPVVTSRSAHPHTVTSRALEHGHVVHDLPRTSKAPEVMVTSTKPPITWHPTQRFPPTEPIPLAKHQPVTTVSQQQVVSKPQRISGNDDPPKQRALHSPIISKSTNFQVAELLYPPPPGHTGQPQSSGSQASAIGKSALSAAKTSTVTQSSSAPKQRPVQNVSAKTVPAQISVPRRQSAVPVVLPRDQGVQQAQPKIVDQFQKVCPKNSTKLVIPPISSATNATNFQVVDHPPAVSHRSQAQPSTSRVQEVMRNVAAQRLPPAAERPSTSTQQPVHQVRHDQQPIQQNTQPPVERAEGAQQTVEALRLPSPNDNYCEEIYDKLGLMFPNIDEKFLTRFCPSSWSSKVSHDEQFCHIVDQLLRFEGEWEMAVKVQPSIGETYERLLEILPNADPTYLHKKAEQLYANEKALDNFLETALESQNYPTRDQYLSKMRVTEEQLRYTKNFTVARFLEKFPDPFAHFMDNNRRCNHSAIGLEFLKSVFNTHRVNTVSRVYRRANYHLSVAADELRRTPSDMVSTRRSSEMPTEDINILQEMAFIRHQQEIKHYIDSMKAAEKAEFEQLKKTSGLLECQCCYDNECMPSKCSTCDQGHIFCNSCITAGTDSRLGEGETHVSCFLSCGSEFSLATLQKILKPTKFSILVKKRQAAEVAAAGLEGLVACPFCHFASIPPEGDKIFKCLNPECMKESCILCKEPNHVPLRCDEVGKADKARKYMEEKMTEALARKCYNCKRAYFKEEGCNKITCPCGAMMCYLCDKKISDYTHFRGQGSDDMAKCPLYSDDARLNAETVRRVAAEVKKELLRQDPTLSIDTTGLLPELPAPRAGPHQQIFQAPQIAAEYAARVLQNAQRH